METIRFNFPLLITDDGRASPEVANQNFNKTPTGKEGINRYNAFFGFILSLLSFAYKVEDKNHKIFYLNRKSLIGWLKENGQIGPSQKVQELFNAVIIPVNLELKIQHGSTKSINDNLKNLIRKPPESSLLSFTDVIAYLSYYFSYNAKLGKFALLLARKMKAKETEDFLEYTVTNTKTGEALQMKQKTCISEEKTSSGFTLSDMPDLKALKELQLTEDASQKWARNSDQSSAFLIDYNTEYTITFPDSYHIKPESFQITT